MVQSVDNREYFVYLDILSLPSIRLHTKERVETIV